MSEDLSKSGVLIQGRCNGFDSYFDKKGVEKFSVLVLVAGASSCLQIGVKSLQIAQNYKPDTNVRLTCTPRFFNGRLSNLELAGA